MQLVLVCECKLTDAAERARLADSIRLRVREWHDVTLHDVVLVRPGTIPKTFSGKRQRSLCRALYERGAAAGRQGE